MTAGLQSKPLVEGYAYRIREERDRHSAHLFRASEIPEQLWNALAAETSALPVGNSNMIEPISAWWHETSRARRGWEANLQAEAEDQRARGWPVPTCHMLTNYSHADINCMPQFVGRLFRVLCFCDAYGRVQYRSAASSGHAFDPAEGFEARHEVEELLQVSASPAMTASDA